MKESKWEREHAFEPQLECNHETGAHRSQRGLMNLMVLAKGHERARLGKIEREASYEEKEAEC